MTPREVHLYFRGQEARMLQRERATWRVALTQAFHTERFARIKRLSPAELTRMLKSLDQMKPKQAQTQQQLWNMIKATHMLMTRKTK